MTERSLIIKTSPHLRHPDSVPKIMYAVLLSLLPAVIASIYFFRFRAVALYLACLGFSYGSHFPGGAKKTPGGSPGWLGRHYRTASGHDITSHLAPRSSSNWSRYGHCSGQTSFWWAGT